MSETTIRTASAEPASDVASPPAQHVVPSAAPGPPATFVQQLHFEHLRNLTTLSVSATGGGLLALQAGLLDFTDLFESAAAQAIIVFLPLLCFAFAAVISLLTQRVLIRDLGTTGTPSTAFAWMSEAASALFGAGVGAAVALLLLAQLI